MALSLCLVTFEHQEDPIWEGGGERHLAPPLTPLLLRFATLRLSDSLRSYFHCARLETKSLILNYPYLIRLYYALLVREILEFVDSGHD